MADRTRSPVQIVIPANARMLRFARMAAAAMAVDLSFSLEEIEDLRIAVDELAAAAIEGLDDSAELVLCIEIDGRDLVVEGEVRRGGAVHELHPVARELIEMLTDDYDLAERDGSRVFRLVKRSILAV